MKVSMAINWAKAPQTGRIEVVGGELLNLLINIGTGSFEKDSFKFTDSGPCRVTCYLDVVSADKAAIKVVDTEKPLSFKLCDVPAVTSLKLPDYGVEVTAEEDALANVDGPGTSGKDSDQKLDLPLYKEFTEDQIKQFGPFQKRDVFETERHVYSTPFMYDNVDVGDFYEIDPTKGIEFKADTGFLTIKEEKPVLGVTVVGSGCTPKGYNICEWWALGEHIDNMTNQLVKRQRVDNLNGTHPSIWVQLLMGTFPGLTYNDVAPGEMKGVLECLKKLSDGYYDGLYMGFYENTAYFRVGPPYPNEVTIRSGCKVPEDPGTSVERYPGDYAIRLVETTVIK